MGECFPHPKWLKSGAETRRDIPMAHPNRAEIFALPAHSRIRPLAHSPFRSPALPPPVPFQLDIERYLLLLNPAPQFVATELVG